MSETETMAIAETATVTRPEPGPFHANPILHLAPITPDERDRAADAENPADGRRNTMCRRRHRPERFADSHEHPDCCKLCRDAAQNDNGQRLEE